jgi:hypothetical protein
MDPILAEAIAPFLAIFGVGTMVLIGMKLRYNYKARIAEQTGSSGDVDRIANAVGDLIDEVQSLRDGLADLNERMEFTERLLTQGRANVLERVDTPE